MAKIYTVNNGKTEKDQIPSIDYMNELLRNIIDDTSNFQSIEATDATKLSTEDNNTCILARNIKTDSNHMFVTNAILDTMLDKPSKFEVENLISDLKQEILNNNNEIYSRIVNSPNVINKLRDISTILNDDETVNGLLNTLAYKLNLDDFQEHTKSSIHMNNNDRKALNVLLKCLINGFADWNAEDGSYNIIKNKPEALPADGGNADTIANHGITELINKYDYDIVIGSSLEKYSEDSCDIYAIEGNVDSDNLISLIKNIKNAGIILFKRGNYVIDHIDSFNKSLIIKGIDPRLTCIRINTLMNVYNSVFKDISLKDSKIYIGSYCNITNVSFTNCEIVLNRSIGCNIIGCTFDNCEIIIENVISNNIIKCNRYIHTNPIKFIGGNNIISENI